jgi:hypothetical protein
VGPPCSLGGEEVFRCSFLLNKVTLLKRLCRSDQGDICISHLLIRFTKLSSASTNDLSYEQK